MDDHLCRGRRSLKLFRDITTTTNYIGVSIREKANNTIKILEGDPTENND